MLCAVTAAIAAPVTVCVKKMLEIWTTVVLGPGIGAPGGDDVCELDDLGTVRRRVQIYYYTRDARDALSRHGEPVHEHEPARGRSAKGRRVVSQAQRVRRPRGPEPSEVQQQLPVVRLRVGRDKVHNDFQLPIDSRTPDGARSRRSAVKLDAVACGTVSAAGAGWMRGQTHR